MWLRLGLAVLWVLILAGAVLLSELATSMGDFDSAVASGRVHTVRLVGELPAEASGSSLVELHWHSGLIDRVSEVHQFSSDAHVSADSSSTDRIVVGDLASHLSRVHPGLRVISQSDAAYPSGAVGIVMGWRVPGWLPIVVVAAWLATLGVVFTGPEPWRATRWAWFWIITNPLGVIGALVFLLLSGPTPLLPSAKIDSRRLHGGWAFIIAMVATGTRSA